MGPNFPGSTAPGKWYENSKILALESKNHSTENLRNLGKTIKRNEIPGQKFSKIWVYLARLYSFPEMIPENAGPLAAGDFKTEF